MANEEIYDLLKKLLLSSKEFAEMKLLEGTLLPIDVQYEKWKMKDFEYSKDGVRSKEGITSEIAIQKDWSNAILMVRHHILNTELASALQNKMSAIDFNKQYDPAKFLSRFLQDYFDEKTGNHTIDEMALSFIKDLRGEPVQCKAVVQLLGMAIEPQIIDLNNGVIIRQTKREDVETQISSFDCRGLDVLNFPSSVMEIVAAVRQPVEMQTKIENAVKILKLFKVGSIRYKSYRMYSQSLNSFYGGTLSMLDDSRPAETGFIKEGEVTGLKQFWQVIENDISKLKRLSNPAEVTFRDIAYARYEDSLMHSGVLERRIADCMMGLETIFLRDGGEQQELSYRLRLRVAKLMNFFGYNPFDVKKIIRDTYETRSKFVHGGLLDYDALKSLSERYGNEKNLLLQVLDYLRISIIVSLLMQIDKPKLIDTIDNSFLDKKSELELEQFIFQSKNALSVK